MTAFLHAVLAAVGFVELVGALRETVNGSAVQITVGRKNRAWF